MNTWRARALPYARGSWKVINEYGIPLASTWTMRRFAKNVAAGKIPSGYGYYKRYGRGPTVPRNFGWWARRKNPPLAVRNAQRINGIMKGKEVKNWDQELINGANNIPTDGTAAVLLPTRLLAEGDTATTRTGRRITLLSCQLRIKILKDPDATRDVVRLIVALHRVCETNGAGGVVYSLLYEPATIYGLRERNTYSHPQSNTKIIYDKAFCLDDGNHQEVFLNLYFDRKAMGLGRGVLTTYGENLGQNLGLNHLQVYLVGTQSTETSGAVIQSRIRFTDS